MNFGFQKQNLFINREFRKYTSKSVLPKKRIYLLLQWSKPGKVHCSGVFSMSATGALALTILGQSITYCHPQFKIPKYAPDLNRT